MTQLVTDALKAAAAAAAEATAARGQVVQEQAEKKMALARAVAAEAEVEKVRGEAAAVAEARGNTVKAAAASASAPAAAADGVATRLETLQQEFKEYKTRTAQLICDLETRDGLLNKQVEDGKKAVAAAQAQAAAKGADAAEVARLTAEAVETKRTLLALTTEFVAYKQVMER